MPIREGVGTETLDGSISVEGYSLDSTRSHHHQKFGATASAPTYQGATTKIPKLATYLRIPLYENENKAASPGRQWELNFRCTVPNGVM